MRDHYELELLLVLPHINDVLECVGETPDVLLVQIGSRLIKRQNSAIRTECLRKSKPNNDRSEDFLTSRAAPLHIQLFFIMRPHHDAVVVVSDA